MKNPAPLGALAAAAILALTGCGAAFGAPSDDELKADAQEMVAEYFSRSQEEARALMERGDLAPLGELLSEEDVEIATRVEESSGVLTAIESISPEGQKAGAEYLQERLPAADMYSLDGLSDAEKWLVMQNAMVGIGFTTETHLEEVRRLTPEDVTLLEGGRAEVDAGDGIGDVFLVRVDDEWKIDGAKNLEIFDDGPDGRDSGGGEEEGS